MSLSLQGVLALGFLLGLRHAFEPDHLAAVSTLATRQGRLRDAAWLGVAWGAGHTLSIAAVALVVMALGVTLPDRFASWGELLVAALLIILGGSVLLRYARGRWHMHRHAHDGNAHIHLHSHAQDPSHQHAHRKWDLRRALGFGLAHGMAGSAAVLVLIVAATSSAASQAGYIIAFGLGTIAGMLMVAFVLGAAIRAASQRTTRLATALHVGAAIMSVTVGLVLGIRSLSV